jgi:hypothetical protein
MTRLDIDVILGYWTFVGFPDVIHKAYARAPSGQQDPS